MADVHEPFQSCFFFPSISKSISSFSRMFKASSNLFDLIYSVCPFSVMLQFKSVEIENKFVRKVSFFEKYLIDFFVNNGRHIALLFSENRTTQQPKKYNKEIAFYKYISQISKSIFHLI